MEITNGIAGAYNGGSTMFQTTDTSADVSQTEFLQLLITQLQCQDPMNPQDSQEFAAQLAQFTSLEELQNMNATMTQGVEADLMMTQTINNTMAASMIGREVHALGNTITLEYGAEPTLNYVLSGFAETVQVEIRDAAGSVIRRFEGHGYSSGDHQLNWDGCNSDGTRMPPGTYSFNVTATNNAGEQIQATPMIIGTIDGVRYGDSGAIFVVDGREIPFSAVMELSMPSTTTVIAPDEPVDDEDEDDPYIPIVPGDDPTYDGGEIT